MCLFFFTIPSIPPPPATSLRPSCSHPSASLSCSLHTHPPSPSLSTSPSSKKAELFNLLFLQTYIWIFFFLLPTRSSSGSAFSLICVHPEFFMTPLLPPPPGFDPIITHKVTSPYHHCLGTFLFVVLSRGWPLVYLSYFLL